MKNAGKKYYAKILLFGEYGVLYGFKALAIPYKKFWGNFTTGMQVDERLLTFANYLEQINRKLHYPLNIKEFLVSVKAGLCFQSCIPLCYGLGSSGALVAAIYDAFGMFDKLVHQDLELLKHDLALIESYFHGSSSGIDPLVSLLNEGVLYATGSGVCLLKTNSIQDFFNKNCLVVDSGVASNTDGLVKRVNEFLADEKAKQNFVDNYKLSDLCIEHLLSENVISFHENFKKLSDYQLTQLSFLFPEEIKRISQTQPIKLLGSGGGGVFLSLRTD